MKNLIKSLIPRLALMMALGLATAPLAFHVSGQTPAKTSQKAASASAPSDTEIADAQSKGLVWVNTGTKVYHKDGAFYGKTKQGRFMTEAEAQKAGYRAAKT